MIDQTLNNLNESLRSAEQNRRRFRRLNALIYLCTIPAIIWVTYMLFKAVLLPGYQMYSKPDQIPDEVSFDLSAYYMYFGLAVITWMAAMGSYVLRKKAQEEREEIIQQLFPNARFALTADLPIAKLTFSKLFPNAIISPGQVGLPAVCHGMLEFQLEGDVIQVFDLAFNKNNLGMRLTEIPILSSLVYLLQSLSRLLNVPAINPIKHQFRGMFLLNARRTGRSIDPKQTFILSRHVSQYLDPNSELVHKFYNTRGKEVVVLEDPTFVEKFKVFGSQLESRKLLSPGLMEQISSFQDSIRSNIRLSLGNKMYLSVENARGLFELGETVSYLDQEYIKAIKEKVEAGLQLYQDLKTKVEGLETQQSIANSEPGKL